MAEHTLNILPPSVNNLTTRIFVRTAGLDFQEVDVWGNPTEPERRALVDNAMFYLIGTLYPLVARATYPVLGFPQYPGEVATAPKADDEMKEQARKDAEEALAEPLEVYNTFFLAGNPFIGGDKPTIADIRLAATLEFLKAIDYDFPPWATEYMERVESALGDAYS